MKWGVLKMPIPCLQGRHDFPLEALQRSLGKALPICNQPEKIT
jgi:hypothetical protein